MQIAKSLPYQNFIYALKLKDIKRQYPVMLSRFLNSMDVKEIHVYLIMLLYQTIIKI
jgi:hypothetical protein